MKYKIKMVINIIDSINHTRRALLFENILTRTATGTNTIIEGKNNDAVGCDQVAVSPENVILSTM